MKGKLIVIEGTDCSGKETQTALLVKYLKEKKEKVFTMAFPNYDSPTGKIIGGPFLGKKYICDGFFPEGAPSVDPKVSSLYFAADRYYNLPIIQKKLEEGYIVILDRYVYSNMAHQAGKEGDKEKRQELYKFNATLEFDLLGLPRADKVIFLYMPVDGAKALRANRPETLDQNEMDEEYLKKSQKAYLELSKLFNYIKIDCFKDGVVRSIEDISKDVIKAYEEKTIKN